MLDLTAYTFTPELTRPARYNGRELASGAAFSADNGQSRGEERTAGFNGFAERAIIHVRKCDEAFVNAPPAIRDIVSFPDEDGIEEEWTVRGIATSGGAYRLSCERKGTRLVNSQRSR